MSRHEDQSQIRELVLQRPIGLDRQLLLGALCTAGQEDNVLVVDPGELPQSVGHLVVAVRLRAVEFHRACHLDDVGIGAELDKPLGILFALHGNQIDAAQQRTNEAADASVPASTALAQASINHRHKGSATVRLANQVGPQFKLGEDQ